MSKFEMWWPTSTFSKSRMRRAYQDVSRRAFEAGHRTGLEDAAKIAERHFSSGVYPNSPHLRHDCEAEILKEAASHD